MFLRSAACALALVALTVIPACKKNAETPEEADEAQKEQAEQEPNNDREHCDALSKEHALVGTLDASDIDVVCPQGLFSVEIFGPPSIDIALEDTRGQRVELGAAQGEEHPTQVRLPGKDWAIVLRGQGDWKAQAPDTDDEDPSYCGIVLGDEASPITLGIQDLPAVFPLCATPKAGAATVRFPSLAPSGVAGFDINIEGADEQTRGTLAVRDEGKELMRADVKPHQRLPRLKWQADAMIDAHVLLEHREDEKTLFLRVDPVEKSEDPQEFLELEPNDLPADAVRIPRPGSIAGELHNGEDVDWFAVEPTAGEVRVEALTQQGTALRVQAIDAEDKVDALRGDDGVYRLCALPQSTEDAPRYVRVGYAKDAEESDGVYQLTFARSETSLDPSTLLKDVEIPPTPPSTDFGFEALPTTDDDADEEPAGFGQTQPADEPSERLERNGRLFPPDVEHGWVFQVPESSEDYHVTVELEGSSSMDLKLRVLDADGIPVANVDKGAAGEGERLELELPTGYYVVAVRATGVKGCDGEYQVKISSPEAKSSPGSTAGSENQNANNPAPSHAEESPTDASDKKPASTKESEPTEDNSSSEGIPDYPW